VGVLLKNIITDYTSDEDIIFLNEFENHFQFVQAKRFNSQFEGIIGQVDEYKIEQKSYTDRDFLKNNNCIDLDNAFDIIHKFEDKISEFSKRFPKKSFVYIEVDCSGGICFYDGFIVKNGEINYRLENSHNGHIELLKKLNKNFKNWNFEPFRRGFFIKQE